MTDIVKIELKGFDKLIASFLRIADNIIAETKKGVAASAILVQNDAKVSMKTPKRGRTYRRGSIKRKRRGSMVVVGSRFHRASAPGEAPAVDTGRLINSINFRLIQGGLIATVGVHDLSQVRYAKYLEYGTAKIQPRPWLIPALERNRVKIQKRLNEAIKLGLTKKV